ncbi:hypothetical protein FT643_16180 [Ketobacter sp. MCCC 1A13808]|uniref:hypothetical protein n=1 Tax=Ketobacter sp. MCCC 1A13808 TaxID=2602738 RepID=UPI0012EC552C|nr:hypothetical protein [Ketobacter sp. MCCC 1A13808]MVF13680.1 hypothetical protein [Ketobacter sp. MCCC 1A13808]
MNKEFSDGPLKASLWLDEFSPALFESEKLVSCSISLSDYATDRLSQESVVTLEVFLHRGPRVLYAHVGGVYKPDEQSSSLEVEVFYVDDLSKKCGTSLALGAGESYVGLEKIYAEAVLSGVKKSLTDGVILFPGTVTINCGVISKFGSAPVVYERLGEQICRAFSSHSSGEEIIAEDIFKLSI